MPLDEHARSGSLGLGVANEAILEVPFDILLDGGELWDRHGVDVSPGRGCARLQGDLQVIFAMRGKGVGSLLAEDIQVIMVSGWDLGVQVGMRRERGLEGSWSCSWGLDRSWGWGWGLGLDWNWS